LIPVCRYVLDRTSNVDADVSDHASNRMGAGLHKNSDEALMRRASAGMVKDRCKSGLHSADDDDDDAADDGVYGLCC
jgi:hypothetical protein